MSEEPVSRTCLFCGKAADTQEHVFPNWVNDLYPAYTLGGVRADMLHVVPERTEMRSYRADEVASLSARAVCGSCASGWMSRLEKAARPILKPLILSQPRTLSMAEQLLAATWAVKTAIVSEAIMQYPDRFPPEDCAIVREQQRPPGRLRVAIAAFAPLGGTHVFTRYIRLLNGRYRDEAPVVDAYVHTIQIGALVLQLRGPDVLSATDNRASERPAVTRDVEIPIFPPVEQRDWPPDAILDEDVLIRYAAGGAELPDLSRAKPISGTRATNDSSPGQAA